MNKKPGVDPTALIERILVSSKTLFAKKGYSGTSMRDIARLSDCSQSMISHHFGSKAELWGKVKDESLANYMLQMRASDSMLSGKNFEEELSSFIDQRLTHFDKEPDMIRMVMWSTLEELEDEKPPRLKELMDVFVSSVRHAQDKGEVRKDIEPELIAYFVLFSTRAWFQDRKCWILKALDMDHSEGLKQFTASLKKILKNGIFS